MCRFMKIIPVILLMMFLVRCDGSTAAEIKYPSKVKGRKTYAGTHEEQLEQLKDDPQMKRWASSRKMMAADRYRPLYHFVNPEGNLNDPNGLCHWKGRYHLFYQAFPLDDPRQHWGHTVSDDLVHWKDLPLAIYPGIENHSFSGSTLVEKDRVIAHYHGTYAGNMIAISSDPLLLNWEKPESNPVIPMQPPPDANGRTYRVYDPCIWKEDEGYYSISGTYIDGNIFENSKVVQHLFFSEDLEKWTYKGPFFIDGFFTGPGEDGAVPYFWPLGDKYILIFASHLRGAQYLIGDFDKVNRKFLPLKHGRFNFGRIMHGGVHAPTATIDDHGRLIVIFNINESKPTVGWDQIMSVPRVLTLRKDLGLGIEPVPELSVLRSDEKVISETVIPANEELVLSGIGGMVIEIEAVIDPGAAREFGLNVLRSPDGSEKTKIGVYRKGLMSASKNHFNDVLVLDMSDSSTSADILARAPEMAPFVIKDGEPVVFRVFIDRSVVEVFVNGEQAAAIRVYPEGEESVGISAYAKGMSSTLQSMKVWQMKTIYTDVYPDQQ
jgi:beta-fructofuranosidase